MSTRDNRLRGAVNLTLPATRANQVGRKDIEDLYRFNLGTRSQLDLQISGLNRKANLEVELYRVIRPISDVLRSLGNQDFRRIKGGDRSANLQLIAVQRGRNASRLLTRTLDAGDYVVRLGRRTGESRYRLSLRSQAVETPDPIDPQPPEDPIEKLPGNSIATALAASIPMATPLQGSVRDGDRQDFYRVNVASPGDYRIQISGLTGDANFQVLGSDGTTVLKNSLRPGIDDEILIQPLDAGTYFFRMFQAASGNNTSYAIRVTPMPSDRYGDTEAEAFGLTSLGDSEQFLENYAVDGGKASPKDVFKFTINAGDQKKFFSARLQDLDGDLNIRLYKAGANFSDPNQFLISNRSGKQTEQFAGTLSEGDYFLEVIPATREGSEYTLAVALSEKKNQPSIIRDIQVGAEGSDPRNVTGVNGFAYFTAADQDGRGLWVSDGTLDRTRKIRSFREVTEFERVGNLLYFVADDGQSGLELWSSNGTTEGTQLVTDLVAGRGSVPRNLTAVGDRLYFLADSAAGQKLYRTTGNSQTPVEVINPTGATFARDTIANLKVVGSNLFFVGTSTNATNTNVSGGNELWRITNAGAATPGTLELIDVNSDRANSSNPRELTVVGNFLYLSAIPKDQLDSRNLFRIDAATKEITNLDSSPNDNNKVEKLSVSGNTLYYFDYPSVDKTGLFKLTNANSSTSTISETIGNSLSNESNPLLLNEPTNLVSVGDALYFFASDTGDSSGTRRLWRTLGDTTVAVAPEIEPVTTNPELVAVGNRLYTIAYRTQGDFNSGIDLWEFNAETNTSRRVDINLLGASSARNLVNTGADTPESTDDALYLVADDGLNGSELWAI